MLAKVGWAEVPPSLNLLGEFLFHFGGNELAEMDLADAAAVGAGDAGFVAKHFERFTDFREAFELLGKVTADGGDLAAFKEQFRDVAGEIVRDVFDENEVALFEGEVSVAEALLELPFNHIFFTGSTRVGKIVMAAAARHLATVTLELGGKSPVIIDEGADVEAIGAALAGAKQFNGGQACISPDYVFVREDEQDRLVEAFGANVAKNLYDDGKIKKEAIAQIVNKPNFDRVKGLFDDAVAQGATVAVGGELDESDLTIHPTMLTGVTPQMKILQEEIFAPIIPVMTYETIDQAIDYIDQRDKPLALYVFSPDEANVDKVLKRTSSGGVTVNGVFSHYLENRLPFGGVNGSGMGSYHGYFGFKAFSHERAVYMHRDAA